MQKKNDHRTAKGGLLIHLFSVMLALLAVLLLTGCINEDNPVRTSLVLDTSTLTLAVGETATRTATSKASDAVITYTSSNARYAEATIKTDGTGVNGMILFPDGVRIRSCPQ